MNCLISTWRYFVLTQFLTSIQIPCLTEKQSAKCEISMSEDELICPLKNMPKNKSPDNDGLTKEFYETFWDELKISFKLLVLENHFLKRIHAVLKKQAVIRLIEKKDKDKRYIQDWRPLSLLNTDVKILSKVMAQCLKKALPFLISSNQSAYVDNNLLVKVVHLL